MVLYFPSVLDFPISCLVDESSLSILELCDDDLQKIFLCLKHNIVNTFKTRLSVLVFAFLGLGVGCCGFVAALIQDRCVLDLIPEHFDTPRLSCKRAKR